VSLLLVVLRFGARHSCNLCFNVVDFFMHFLFCPLCSTSYKLIFWFFLFFGVGWKKRKKERVHMAKVWEVVCWGLVWIFIKMTMLCKQR
jgi:hypothetical protein